MTNKILTVLAALALAACGDDLKTEPQTSTCAQYVREACDAGDAECAAAVMDDCAPPTCDPPPGQHC